MKGNGDNNIQMVVSSCDVSLFWKQKSKLKKKKNDKENSYSNLNGSIVYISKDEYIKYGTSI